MGEENIYKCIVCSKKPFIQMNTIAIYTIECDKCGIKVTQTERYKCVEIWNKLNSKVDSKTLMAFYNRDNLIDKIFNLIEKHKKYKEKESRNWEE
ncbi:MAG: hypothetical protein GY853_15605 [PVC group bacterium]|nr:hypothetical protein [PVC group bacterium]